MAILRGSSVGLHSESATRSAKAPPIQRIGLCDDFSLGLRPTSAPALFGRQPIAGFPHLHRPVPAAAGEALAVGAERHAGNAIRVPLEGEYLQACGRIPYLYCPV